VGWWGERVSVRHAAGTQKNADRHSSISLAQAEKHTGITQPQVSKWRHRLKDKDAYRDLLYGVAWRQAMGIVPVASSVTSRPTVALPAGKYRTIVCDPPWPMQKIEREVAPNQFGFPYQTMSEDELLSFPLVSEVADDASHLWLWTTQRFLPHYARENQ
jgi:hypothetical protein